MSTPPRSSDSDHDQSQTNDQMDARDDDVPTDGSAGARASLDMMFGRRIRDGLNYATTGALDGARDAVMSVFTRTTGSNTPITPARPSLFDSLSMSSSSSTRPQSGSGFPSNNLLNGSGPTSSGGFGTGTGRNYSRSRFRTSAANNNGAGGLNSGFLFGGSANNGSGGNRGFSFSQNNGANGGFGSGPFSTGHSYNDGRAPIGFNFGGAAQNPGPGQVFHFGGTPQYHGQGPDFGSNPQNNGQWFFGGPQPSSGQYYNSGPGGAPAYGGQGFSFGNGGFYQQQPQAPVSDNSSFSGFGMNSGTSGVSYRPYSYRGRPDYMRQSDRDRQDRDYRVQVAVRLVTLQHQNDDLRERVEALEQQLRELTMERTDARNGQRLSSIQEFINSLSPPANENNNDGSNPEKKEDQK